MTTQEFDEAVRTAAKGIDFGPHNGLGGYGADQIFARLPEKVRGLYLKWGIPIALLAGRDSGHSVRFYAEDCAINVMGDLEKIEA